MTIEWEIPVPPAYPLGEPGGSPRGSSGSPYLGSTNHSHVDGCSSGSRYAGQGGTNFAISRAAYVSPIVMSPAVFPRRGVCFCAAGGLIASSRPSELVYFHRPVPLAVRDQNIVAIVDEGTENFQLRQVWSLSPPTPLGVFPTAVAYFARGSLVTGHSPAQWLQKSFPCSASQTLADGEARDSVAKLRSMSGQRRLAPAIRSGVRRSMKERFAFRP